MNEFKTGDLKKVKVLVIGDIMLDTYEWGVVSRISPEAPVPVVKSTDTSEVVGGAGNVAANLAGLKSRATLVGVKGDDRAGVKIENLLLDKNITPCLVTDTSRPTTIKTRIMAQGQQLFRLDREETKPVPEETAQAVLEEFRKNLPFANAVIISDYGKGLLTSGALCSEVIASCRKSGTPVLVDPKGSDWSKYYGATVITPNSKELMHAAGLSTDKDMDLIVSGARRLIKETGLEWMVVTLGPLGMMIVGKDGSFNTIPARAREVFDVSGAGDTVIGVLGACLGGGMSLKDGAIAANSAAGLVVGKIGTQPVTAIELEAALAGDTDKGALSGSKILTREAAALQVRAWKAAGEKTVFTNGCFDLLHPGHIALLNRAGELGTKLVVGLNTDESVKKLKGNNRPILGQTDRASILSAIACVDMVVLFDEDTPIKLISSLKPDILVKGADYRPDQVVGREIVESYNGKVCLIPILKGHSTTKIANKILCKQKDEFD